MRAMYGEYLSSDMVQVAHHGGTGCEFELYDLIDAQCVWWTTVYTSFRSEIDPSKTGKNALITNAQVNDDCWDIIILSDGYNVMMTLRPDGADLDRLENIADDDAAMEYGQYIIRPEDIPSIRATL